jgi:hypothetical protein
MLDKGGEGGIFLPLNIIQILWVGAGRELDAGGSTGEA